MEKVDQTKIVNAYRSARRRLFFLDYEGTLVNDKSTMRLPASPEVVTELLFSLTGNASNEVVVLSNQVKENLEELFNYLPLTLVAENGGFFRIARNQWQALYNGSLAWKDPVVHALSTMSIKYKGSSVEKKHFSVTWNYDTLKDKVALEELHQFQVVLRSLAKKYGLKLHEYDSTIEFSIPEITRGKFAANWVSTHGEFDFILAMGDDWTDEDLFETVGRTYFTIRVGHSTNSAARYYIEKQGDVIPFIKGLIDQAVV
jgi:trehalose 6-phosphate synthase/phosphatase